QVRRERAQRTQMQFPTSHALERIGKSPTHPRRSDPSPSCALAHPQPFDAIRKREAKPSFKCNCRSSSSTKCASTCAVNALLCCTSFDNPATSSAFPTPINRYWLLISPLYHTKFKPTHGGLNAIFGDKMALNSLGPLRASLRKSSRKHPPKSNSLPTTTQPDARTL